MAKKKTQSFEKSLKELELIVKQIDSGNLELEDSLTAFEKGITLIRECQQSLQVAEQKVNTLTENNDGFEVKPIDTDQTAL